jgi:hypothetical protein
MLVGITDINELIVKIIEIISLVTFISSAILQNLYWRSFFGKLKKVVRKKWKKKQM